MSVGIVQTKADVDYRVGIVAMRVAGWFALVKDTKAWLDQFTAQNLVDNFGYTLAEANLIKSAFSDLDQLRTIYEGSANLASVKDFRAFAKQLYAFATALPGN